MFPTYSELTEKIKFLLLLNLMKYILKLLVY